MTTAKLTKQMNKKFTSHLTCRIWQHLWNVNRGDVTSDGGYLLWSMPCDRCETVKTIKVRRRTGRIEGTSYVYPADYGFQGLGALDADKRGSIRLTLLDRFGKL